MWGKDGGPRLCPHIPFLTLLLSFLAGFSAASKAVVRHQQVGLGTG